MSATAIDESAFSKNERPGEFDVRIAVEGEFVTTIHADSLEDARAKARAILSGEDVILGPDEVTEVRIRHVRKSPVMYRILREGIAMQVSHLQEGDLPREPDERGF